MTLVLALGLALLACGALEAGLHRRNLERIPVRVLVNGTRGKSSVTRLVAGALRESGCPTVAKTTGSAARIILEDGSELPLARPFGARITEQKALARLAARRGARALVVECMAVRPESQEVMQSQLVRATLGLITNARVDHVEEMGPSLEETLAALAGTVPRGGTLVTAEPRLAEPAYARRARRVVLAEAASVGPELLASFPYPVFAENLALALAAAEELGIERETALRGMAKARPDLGALGLWRLELPSGPAYVVNAFAANDLASTALAWEEAARRLPAGLPVFLLYNGRADREYRLAEFLELPARIPGLAAVAAAGQYARKAARAFARRGYPTLDLEPGAGCEAILASLAARAGGGFVLFGAGNFQGLGRELAERCEREGSIL
ncbi:MAG TPA: poly-gamma-glutamate synthase PgsB [Spirochaetales bacterium]|nr:poly-gamma-glutamate synthase PgsB [Spirochaetales bacterium]HRY53165.1 poly-gamma-glutamate synthase PgsB [Spirochaetia bacterium]HRZ63294.1 poly-gamma-glutamate synthase PgsB [Spirochaetia bacterium]